MKIEAGLTIFLGKFMKDIKKGSIKHLIIQIIASIIAALIIFPLVDFISCKIFQNSEFVYTFKDYVIEPIIAGVLLGLVLWALDKRSAKKSK